MWSLTRAGLLAAACVGAVASCGPQRFPVLNGGFADGGGGFETDGGTSGRDAGSLPAVLHPDFRDVDPTPSPDCAGSVGAWTAGVSGRIVDQDGQPIAGAKAQLCIRVAIDERFICLRPSDSDADGVFAVVVPELDRCVEEGALRILVPLTDYSITYCDVDLSHQSAFTNVDRELVLFHTQGATNLPPRGTESSARTVGFADGLEITVTPSRMQAGPDDYAKLAAARVDPTHPGLCFVDSQTPMDGVYAFVPEANVDGADFPVRIPNDTGLAPGSQVALYVLGGLSCALSDGSHIKEADWLQYGIGVVNAAGSHIEGLGTDGIPCLTWLGYRKL